jgi:hypothetical protein
MSREIDERKKRKALRKLRKAAELAGRGEGPPLSDWEQTFLEEVEERIKTYGSAFADPEKGDLDDAMSALQAHKLKEIGKKARGKGGGLKTRKPLGSKNKPAYTPRVRQLDDDIEAPPPASAPDLTEDPPQSRPSLRLVSSAEAPADDMARPSQTPGKPRLKLVPDLGKPD